MRPKKLYLRYGLFVAAWLCLYSGVSQPLNIYASASYRTFTHKEGFEVNEVNSMQYDQKGWLWISGKSYQIANNQINNRKLILQRYDGNLFHTVELPDLPDEYYNFIELIQ